MLQHDPLTRSLLLLSGFLLVALLVPSLWPLPYQATSSQTRREMNTTISNNAWEPVESDEILSRPLFRSDRKQYVPVANRARTPVRGRTRVEKAPFRIAGLLGASASDLTVYMQHIQTQATVSAKVGGVIDGWQVISITQQSVVLEKNGNRQTLRVSDKR